MAVARKNLKLQPFKVTQSSTSGRKCHKQIPRGISTKNEPIELVTESPTTLDLSVKEEHVDSRIDTGISLRKVTQDAYVYGWNEVRPLILRASVESTAMPQDQMCNICLTNEASHRCTQCGPPTCYFCLECFQSQHSKCNFFHSGEVWEVRLIIIEYIILISHCQAHAILQ